MVRRKEHTPEDLAKARHLYEKTLAPVDDIAAMLGLSKTPFYRRVKELGWERRRASHGTFEFARAMTGTMLEPEQATNTDAPADPLPPAASHTAVSEEARHALALRIQRVAERELDAIERILDMLGPSSQPEADRCARTLAGLSRTLREITALNMPEKAIPADDPDDDTIPIDLDELRCELARRIDEVIEARYRAAPGNTD